MSLSDLDLSRSFKELRERVDQETAFQRIVTRRRRRSITRRLQRVGLAGAVVLGSVLGAYGLWEVFTPATRMQPGAADLENLLYWTRDGRRWDLVRAEGGPALASTQGGSVSSAISRSGDWIAIAEGKGQGRGSVRLVSLTDGEVQVVGNLPPVNSVSWAGDDEVWLCDGNGTIRSISIPTGDMALIARTARCVDLAISADGTRLAFSTSNGDIVIASRADPSSGHVVVSGVNNGHPSWSPDGTQLAFHTYEGSGASIRILDIASERVKTAVAGTDEANVRPAWAPDGRTIAFVHVPQDGPSQVKAFDAARGTVKTVDSSETEQDLPFWRPMVDEPTAGSAEASPTPTSLPPSGEGLIAFSDDGQAGWDIFAMRPDGSGISPLVTASGDDVSPRLSADGRKLAYVGLGGSDRLFLLDLVQGETRSLHEFGPDEQVADMAWSPDGTRIALVVEEVLPDSRPKFIHVLNVSTGEMQRITHTGRENSVDWSPDGSRILFARSSGPLKEDKRFISNDLYLVNPDGSHETQLTKDGLSMEGAWSPDGNHVAFTSYEPSDGGQTDIYVMDADGTERTRLTHDPGMDYYPVWSPDGSRILFVSRRTDGPPTGASSCHLMVIGIDGSKEASIIRDPSHICGADPSWASAPRDGVN